MECQGECKNLGTCTGEIRRVFVTGRWGEEWGWYNYCDTAIKKDMSNGYKVEEEDE